MVMMMVVEQTRRSQPQPQQQNLQSTGQDGGRRRLRRKRAITNSHFLLLTTVMSWECSAVSGSSSSSSSSSAWPPPPPSSSSSSSSSSPPSPSQDNPLISRLEASIFAESALVDKESGRIYWEGGCRSTLSASLVPHLQKFGFVHMRAMVLTCFLLLAVLGALSSWLRFKLEECELFHTLVSSSRHSYCSSIVLFVINRLLLGAPRLHKWFIATIIILYLVESYTCETHDYLRNAIASPQGVEDYIERIRQEPPHVHWKVQSFHYVPTSPWEAIHQAIVRTTPRRLQKQSQHLGGGGEKDHSQVGELTTPGDDDTTSDDVDDANAATVLYSPNKRKRVTERATGSYQYKHWQDKTIAGIWQRAQSSSSSSCSSSSSSPSSRSSAGSSHDHPAAPFAKIVLTKLLVLADKKTRLDYFQQQAAFVAKHNQQLQQRTVTAALDEFAEFSTHIHVAGFQPRLLAVRQRPAAALLPNNENNNGGGGIGAYWHKIFRLHHFWLFTLLGLTLPYRIWFGRHCDELRVTVVKETSTLPITSSSSSSSSLSRGWFSGKAQHGVDIENFRELMERLQLYAKQDSVNSSCSSSQQQQEQASSVAEIEEAIQVAALLKEKLISSSPSPLQSNGDGMLAASGSRKLRAGSTKPGEEQ